MHQFMHMTSCDNAAIQFKIITLIVLIIAHHQQIH